MGTPEQLLLVHLVQDVLPENSGQAELSTAHQAEDQLHQQLQDLLCQLHQAEGQGHLVKGRPGPQLRMPLTPSTALGVACLQQVPANSTHLLLSASEKFLV